MTETTFSWNSRLSCNMWSGSAQFLIQLANCIRSPSADSSFDPPEPPPPPRLCAMIMVVLGFDLMSLGETRGHRGGRLVGTPALFQGETCLNPQKNRALTGWALVAASSIRDAWETPLLQVIVNDGSFQAKPLSALVMEA